MIKRLLNFIYHNSIRHPHLEEGRTETPLLSYD